MHIHSRIELMKVDGKPYRTIWVDENGWSVNIIDQTRLPHVFSILSLRTLDDACRAIRNMLVRGAPLIGATAAYGICLALREDSRDSSIDYTAEKLLATRPTAVNLRWAVNEMKRVLTSVSIEDRIETAYTHAARICDNDVAICSAIGDHGKVLIEQVALEKGVGEPVNILTHCNAGWLATVDWGTALAPIYKAHEKGVPIHIWVDETRPRNQGASLTAWELQKQGINFTVVVDNTGGHLMQNGLVDLCLVGTDRTAANGDVCNKIGTYLKALAAHDNGIPFYVALPSPTIDWKLENGQGIPIEKRDADEIIRITGRNSNGRIDSVEITPPGCEVANYAFDVTPARLVTGLITERGICPASTQGLHGLFPGN